MRHLLVFAAILGLLAGLYFWGQGRTASLEGRVYTRDLEGREVPGAGAKVMWYRADLVGQQLVLWLADYHNLRRENGLSLRAARNDWKQKATLRDEAARILRVAEGANSADLDVCRGRHREAAADAEDALRHLESLESAASQASDPARFLASLPPPSVEFATDSDGRFRVDAPHGVRGFVFAALGGGEGKEAMVWWREVVVGEGEPLEFSNANVLTAEMLAGIAQAQKMPEDREGSQAE